MASSAGEAVLLTLLLLPFMGCGPLFSPLFAFPREARRCTPAFPELTGHLPEGQAFLRLQPHEFPAVVWNAWEGGSGDILARLHGNSSLEQTCRSVCQDLHGMGLPACLSYVTRENGEVCDIYTALGVLKGGVDGVTHVSAYECEDDAPAQRVVLAATGIAVATGCLGLVIVALAPFRQGVRHRVTVILIHLYFLVALASACFYTAAAALYRMPECEEGTATTEAGRDVRYRACWWNVTTGMWLAVIVSWFTVAATFLGLAVVFVFTVT